MIDAIRTTDIAGASPDHPVELGTADSAAWLKQELKRRFPATKFGVRGDRGTAAGWYTVSWTDGPTAFAVAMITSEVVGTSFDAQTDSTTYYVTRAQWCPKRGQWVRPRVRSIDTRRALSDGFRDRVAQAISARYGTPVPPRDQWHRAQVCNGSWSEYWTWNAVVYRAAEDRSILA